jgi:hypothetical protein
MPPYLFTMRLIYHAVTDSEEIADGLNPLTISHTARTISCKNMGSCKTSQIVDVILPNITNKPDAKYIMAPTRPQTEIHLGMSFD